MQPNVLIVDDNVALLSTLKPILEAYGFCVTTAGSAAEAKTKLAASQFDVVLTDMKMESDQAGYDVVRAATSKPEHPVILIMTAFPLLTSQWRTAGAHHVFVKPAAMADLLDAIDKLLAVRRATSRAATESPDNPSLAKLRRA